MIMEKKSKEEIEQARMEKRAIREKKIAERQKAREEKEALKIQKRTEKQIIEAEKLQKKLEKEDARKVIPFRKLPKMFRKRYSPGKYKSILRHVYVPRDRETVKELFEEYSDFRGNHFFYVSEERLYSKKEIKYYKALQKQIKNNRKLRVRLAPLILTVSVIVALVVTVCTFKNMVLRKLIIKASQSIAGAKCELDYFDLNLTKACFTLKGYRVGNQYAEYRNLFELDKVQFDFRMLHLLSGKFHCQNMEISGIQWNTRRTTSCRLPGKKKPSVPFSKVMKDKTNQCINDLDHLVASLFGSEDIDSILVDIYRQLKSPAMVQEITQTVDDLVAKWKDVPAEVKEEVQTFAKTVENLKTIKASSFQIQKKEDLDKIYTEIQKIKDAIDESKKITGQVKGYLEEIQKDVDMLNSLADRITVALREDTKTAERVVNTVVDTVRDPKNILSKAIEIVFYDYLGKYYVYGKTAYYKIMEYKSIAEKNYALITGSKPYQVIKQLVDQEMSYKSREKAKQKELQKLRRKGTTFWYSSSTPKFLIERIKISGHGTKISGIAFNAEIHEFTNDQNLRNIPTTANIFYSYADQSHEADITVDFRTASKKVKPLIDIEYKGKGFEVEFTGEGLPEKKGIPTFTGTMDLTVRGSGGDGLFSAGGQVSMDPISIKSDGFENEYATKYYNIALGSIDSLKFGYDLDYRKDRGLDFSVNGNFGEQFVKAMENTTKAALGDAKKLALQKVNEMLAKNKNKTVAKVQEFLGIQDGIKEEDLTLANLQKTLETKKAELEGKIKQYEDIAKAKVEEEKNKAIQKGTDEIKKQLEKSGIDSTKAGKAADVLKNAAGSLKIPGLR